MSEIHHQTIFHSVEINKDSGLPTIVFFGGFPDNETSGWGEVIPTAFRKTHHVVFLCLPGYHRGGTLRPWAYDVDELIDLLHATLTEVLPRNKPFDFVCHDWGAYFGLLYQNTHPDRIKTLTLIDVGMFSPLSIPVWHAVVIVAYQSWFAITYWLSQVFGQVVAFLFLGVFFLPIFNPLRPVNEKIYVPVKSITPEKCYPYYYTIKAVATNKVRLPKFPSCPTFFMYGKEKNAHFHDERFLNKLQTTDGCQYRAYDAGHWLQITKADEALADIQSFLKKNSK